MRKYFFPALTILTFTHCTQPKTKATSSNRSSYIQTIYSSALADSFTLFISLPPGYNSNDQRKFPVVYLLDANLYFDILAPTFNKYAEVGLTPSVILIGIGYKNFPVMDSLRNRDYTYPTALPEYEMTTSGGAAKFFTFLKDQLIPLIDSDYKTDTINRILMGHSLGGYFSAYALLQNVSGKDSSFSSYIAASPSLHYNNYWLLKEFENIPGQITHRPGVKAYISFGGLEQTNETEQGEVRLDRLSGQLAKIFEKQSAIIAYKNDIFSNLDHMDTQIPTFIKGLQWCLDDK